MSGSQARIRFRAWIPVAAGVTSLRRKAASAGMPVAAFIRAAAREEQVRQAPPVGVVDLVLEIRKRRSGLEQLMETMGQLRGPVALDALRMALDENRVLEQKILAAYEI